MNRRLKTIALVISVILCLIILADSRKISIAREALSSPDQNPEMVGAIAHQLTVRLIGDYTAGSGVIIGHQGSTYQV